MLPASYPTHPLSWSDVELEELAGTGLDTSIKTTKAALKQIFDHLTEKLVQVLFTY